MRVLQGLLFLLPFQVYLVRDGLRQFLLVVRHHDEGFAGKEGVAVDDVAHLAATDGVETVQRLIEDEALLSTGERQ